MCLANPNRATQIPSNQTPPLTKPIKRKSRVGTKKAGACVYYYYYCCYCYCYYYYYYIIADARRKFKMTNRIFSLTPNTSVSRVVASICNIVASICNTVHVD